MRRLSWLAFVYLVAGLLVASNANGDEVNYYFRAGSGFTNNVQSGIYSIGRDGYLGDNFFLRTDLGFWTDTAPNHKGSIFASFALGKRFGNLRGWNLSLVAGPLSMSSPDENLGSSLQFTEEVFVGYQNLSIGVKHISNAGIVLPNRSRDSVIIQWTVPIWE